LHGGKWALVKKKYFYEYLPKAGGINIPNIFWDFNELHAPNDKVKYQN
jgi:hypothetical protein